MISKDKTYCTRGGQEVRIYATDAGGLFPVHGAIFQDGTWHGMKWTEEGKTHFTTTSCMVNTVDDLVEVKPRHKRTVWLNVYDNEVIHGGWRTKEEADNISHRNRVACIKLDLDFEEGEGL
jgi:hypothetical protein